MTSEPDFDTIHLARPGIRKVLGDLEAEIMELIWERPADQGTAVRDIFPILYERRGLAYTTVMSTMQRLARKGLLRVEMAEPAFVYYPTYTQDAFVTRFVRQIVDDLLTSFTGQTLEALRNLPDTAEKDKVAALLDIITRRRAAEEDHSG
ncbi:MAG TPA: BlaI/MecI/CopY family transcriptional regulator [Ktedonobacterales bacterium]|nr:BlaI/MecI/CopY family transcriptional regulator [Ktedonobacterales bacterium]